MLTCLAFDSHAFAASAKIMSLSLVKSIFGIVSFKAFSCYVMGMGPIVNFD